MGQEADEAGWGGAEHMDAEAEAAPHPPGCQWPQAHGHPQDTAKWGRLCPDLRLREKHLRNHHGLGLLF